MTNILVIDDQACIRELYAQELTRDGYAVTAVGDAESVREELKSSRPDLVLLDLHLDESRGWDLLGEIKRRDSQLPVLIVTAYDTHVEDPRLSQAEGYVLKSLYLDELKQKVLDILSRKRAQKRHAEVREHVALPSAV